MRMTKHQKKLIEKIKCGGLHAFRDGSAAYYTADDGSELPTRTVNALITKGVLVPVGDGLFPGFTQSYRLA